MRFVALLAGIWNLALSVRSACGCNGLRLIALFFSWRPCDEQVQTAIAKYATAVRSCNTAWVERLKGAAGNAPATPAPTAENAPAATAPTADDTAAVEAPVTPAAEDSNKEAGGNAPEPTQANIPAASTAATQTPAAAGTGVMLAIADITLDPALQMRVTTKQAKVSG